MLSLALMFFLILGAVSAADDGNVSSIQTSNDDLQLAETVQEDANVDNAQETLAQDSQVENDTVSTADSGVENDTLSSVESVDNQSDENKVDVLGSVENKSAVGAASKITYKLQVVSPSNLVNKDAVVLKLTDSKGKAVAKQKVTFNMNGKSFVRYTDASGQASLKINLPETKTYKVNYMFNEKGYTTIKGNTMIFVVQNPQTKLIASNCIIYKKFSGAFNAVLSVDKVKLSGKKIRFVVAGKTYYRTTDKNGKASLPIKLKAGKYAIRYYFDGEKNLLRSYGKKLITVKSVMPITMTKMSSVYMYENTPTPFKVKVLDIKGRAVKGKVTFKFNKKSFTRTIDKNGIAFLNIKTKPGTYKIICYHKQDGYGYKAISYNIKVKSKGMDHCGGFWIFGSDMKNVNLNTLAKYGTDHIFLNYYALEAHGQSAVEDFIKNAASYGIKVHIWMQAFYTGGWISPVNDDGSYKYSYFNEKIDEAVRYAKIKGVAGVHLDYLRFPGTAYNHANGVDAINYFTKELAAAVHNVNPNLIVSAAIMPEPSSNIHYYGQDVPTLSKYLDVLIPMIYKGNYNAGTSWIKSTTETFVKQSNGAKIWAGLQGYKSDSDVTNLLPSELRGDAEAAYAGGAKGIIIFRWGVTNFINFDDL